MKHTKDRPAQFLACFEAWCDHFRTPPFDLYEYPGVKASLPDRCLIKANADWLEWLEANSEEPYPCLEPWHLGIERHDPLKLGFVTAARGWRGTKPFAAIQINEHCAIDRNKHAHHCLEVDFDLGNPSRGLLPLAVHATEFIVHWISKKIGEPVRTDPYRVAKWMRRAGIKVRRV